MTFALLVLMVFISAAAIDYAEARYVRAVGAGAAHVAARWSLAMWALGCLGFVAMLRVSLWLMIPEGIGFYVGTFVAVRWSAVADRAPRDTVGS